MRLAKAQAELTEFYGDGEGVEYQKLMDGVPEDQSKYECDRVINDKRRNLREKYEIPDDVYLFYECDESALTPQGTKGCMSYFSAWVKGKLTKEQFWHIEFYFEEVNQADWGWIMLERPFGYYGLSDDDQEPIIVEMQSIGTRSRSKNTKLPPLARIEMLK